MSTHTCGLSHTTRQYVDTYWRRILELPEPSETWVAYGLEIDLSAGELNRMRLEGIIRAVETVYQRGKTRYRYETNRQIYEKAETIRENHDPERLPCGHAVRFENKDGRIHCKHRHCSDSWPSKQVKDYLSNQGDQPE